MDRGGISNMEKSPSKTYFTNSQVETPEFIVLGLSV